MAGVTLGLASHRITLFYECRLGGAEIKAAVPTVTIRQAATGSEKLDWLDPQRLDPGAQRNLGDQKIWRYGPLTVSHDLHPATRSILATAVDSGADSASDPSAAVKGKPGCFKLTDQARHLLSGGYRPAKTDAPKADAPDQGLVLRLVPQMAQRIGLVTGSDLTVHLQEVMFFGFGTGIGLAVIEVEIVLPTEHAAPLTVLIEAAHLLSDERRSRPPLLTWADNSGKPARFHLSDLLRPLLQPAGYAVSGERRIFSYTTAVTTGGDGEQCRDIALRLSRHYNYAYAPVAIASGTEITEPFVNVVHATSLEGAATLVTLPTDGQQDGSQPEFLTNWLAAAYRPAYLPIAIVAYHEHVALLDLAQSAAIELDFDALPEAQIAELRRLCHRFLAFRLRYRPAQVSFITMHNEFSNSLRRMLGIEPLSQKAAQDAVEAELRLSRHMAERDAALAEAERKHNERRRKEVKVIERKRERRWAWHGTLVACLLAVLAVLNFAEQMSETPVTFIRGGFDWSGLDVAQRIKLVGLFLAFLSGIAGGYINWFRLRQGDADDELLEEAKTDQAMERTAKARRQGSEEKKKEE